MNVLATIARFVGIAIAAASLSALLITFVIAVSQEDEEA